jgi:ankyrin repeat protein
MVVAARPLRVEELAEVLSFDFTAEGIPKLNVGWRWMDQEAAVLSACSSLVIVVNDGDSRIVQFSHFSVKEFLTADRLAEPIRDVSRYHIQLEAAHSILAQACLGVLLRLDDRIGRDDIKNFPLALYAARYWPTHARFENASSRIKNGMECLFDADKPHFTTWLWIYNENEYGLSMPTAFPEKPRAVPLYYAARLGFRDLAEHLIAEHPEHVNARDTGPNKATPMYAAAGAGYADILSLLHQHGGDVEWKNPLRFSLLHQASRAGKLEAGQFLLDCGLDINAQAHNGWTPLFYAVSQGHIEFARMLLKRGARTDILDNSNSRTPLHFAVIGRNIQLVRLLLEHGADVNARDNYGETPSQMGSRQGRYEIVELLSEYGAEPVL